jgi:hypothetical protein
MTLKLTGAGLAGSENLRGRIVLGMMGAFFLCVACALLRAGNPADVPSVSAGMGPCTADFTVVDAASKPIYNAKVYLKMKYGFMSKRDTDLEVATNTDGKAHMEGLPNKLKKPPLEFTVTKDTASQTVTADPATNCHATFAVTLGK